MNKTVGNDVENEPKMESDICPITLKKREERVNFQHEKCRSFPQFLQETDSGCERTHRFHLLARGQIVPVRQERRLKKALVNYSTSLKAPGANGGGGGGQLSVAPCQQTPDRENTGRHPGNHLLET